MNDKKINTALISVYNKEGLEPILEKLNQLNVQLISTGGTFRFINEKGYHVNAVEELSNYPSILGGRVKTLHPKIFGGILARRDEPTDQEEVKQYEIPSVDLVIVDLYPFEETVKSEVSEEEIIEKIDIGGIALIRAAAKNFNDVLVISEKTQYTELENILSNNNGIVTLEERKKFAKKAFDVTSHYDTSIFNYFNSGVDSSEEPVHAFKYSLRESKKLRYGENPHQEAFMYGNLEDLFDQLNGKELSYNNLVDIDAAVGLIDDFEDENRPAFAILKHTNACGVAIASNVKDAYNKALEGDPVSAFGGVLICNAKIDAEAAEEIHKLFVEVLAAPDYDDDALEILKQKKNRVILKRKPCKFPSKQAKSILNGVLEQDRDLNAEGREDLDTVTQKAPDEQEVDALIFANKIVKHTKSNAIVLARKDQLIASGVGQTSRVDALNQAITKAKHFGFDLQGCVMASDAFFPFPDCVEIASKEGITAVIQPGGSKKDQDSVAYCDKAGMSMVVTGIRHFKH